MNIKQDLTLVNFTTGGMKEIRGIVIHSMWGTYGGSIAWFKNPDAKASAHYCVSDKGEITQCVKDTDMAWHAGVYDEPIEDWLKPNPNYYCLGIELHDNKDANWQYPDEERKAAAELVASLMAKYNIPKSRVVLHRNLNPSRRSDPVGAFSYDWLFSAVDVPPSETDEDRALKVLKSYRSVRVQGPEGNFEGYVNAVIGSDRDVPNKEKNIADLQKALGESKTELTTKLTIKEKEIETLNTSWMTKVDLLNKKLAAEPTYVLNLTGAGTLLNAFINKVLGKSKTREQLDAELGLKGVTDA